MEEPSVKIEQRCRALWEEAVRYYEPWHSVIQREKDFALKLRHYRVDPGDSVDARRVMYRGRELYSAIRRKVADVMRAPIYIEPQPVGDDDAASLENVKWSLEHDIRDPMNGFKVWLERVVMDALASKVGYLAVDWEPDCGPFGDITFRKPRNTKVFICPPYQDIYDKMLPWVIEEFTISREEAQRKRGWKNTDQLVSDTDAPDKDTRGVGSSDENGRVFSAGYGAEGGAVGRVTMIKVWFKWDPDKKTVARRKPETERELPRNEWMDWCPTCGMKIAVPQATDAPVDEDASGDMACPMCAEGGSVVAMQRITHSVDEEISLAYPDGRLVIYAPHCNVVVYDGAWPEKVRSYPYMKLTAHEHPDDPMGMSETGLNKDMQVLSNSLVRRGCEMALQAPNLLIMNGTQPLKNSRGDAFTVTDEPWQIAYADMGIGQAIQHFQANPVPAALLGLYNTIQNSFRSDMGTAEISNATRGNEIKDIPVGTIDAWVESGNIPTDHLISRVRQSLSVFLAVVHDIQRQRWTYQRWVRFLGPRGVIAAKQMSMLDIPGADIQVSADPEFKARTKEQLATLQFWLSNGAGDALAEVLGIPPTMAQKFKDEMQQQQAAVQPSGPAMIPGVSDVASGAESGMAVEAA